MQNNEVQQMLTTIIEHAQTKPHVSFKLLTNWSDYRYYQGKRKYLKVLIRVLDRGAERLFKSYCKDVVIGTSSVNKLIAFNQLQQIRKYYEIELQTVTEMIWEYEAYLLEGNYLWAFLGSTRSEEDMRDFRE